MSTSKKHIAIYRTRGIGDVILSFEGLNELYQLDVHIYYIGYGETLDLVKHFFPQVITVDIGKASIFKTYKIAKNAIPSLNGFIDLQRNSRSILLLTFFRFSRKFLLYKWNNKSVRRRLIVAINNLKGRKIKPDIVKRYKQPEVKESFSKCFFKCIDDLGDQMKRNSGIKGDKQNGPELFDLIIAPGASHKAKKIPPELLKDIFEELNHNEKLKIGIVGDSNDFELCMSVESNMASNFTTTNFCSKKDLISVAEIINASNLVLAADSAILHLAVFLKKPVIVLLGPTIEGFGYVNAQDKTFVFSRDIYCRPCSVHGTRDCRYKDYKCFMEIDRTAVAACISELLQ
jgi:heptosyltransferase-2